MIGLEWNGDNIADVSEWFGEGCEYRVGYTRDNSTSFIFHSGPKEGFITNVVGGASHAKAAALEDFNTRLKKPMGYMEAMAAVERGCEVQRKAWTPYCTVSRSGSGERPLFNGFGYAPSFADQNATDWVFVLPERETKPKLLWELVADICRFDESEARRLCTIGYVRVNDCPVRDPYRLCAPEWAGSDIEIVLKRNTRTLTADDLTKHA